MLILGKCMSLTKRNFLKAVSCAYFFYSFKALTKDNQPIGNYIPAKDKNTWPSKVHRVEEFTLVLIVTIRMQLRRVLTIVL